MSNYFKNFLTIEFYQISVCLHQVKNNKKLNNQTFMSATVNSFTE